MADPQAPSSGGASQLVSDIHTKMSELMQLIEGSPQVAGPDDRDALAQVIQSYQSFVEGLSAPPGGQAPKAQQPGGPVPVEAGAQNVRPAL